MNASLLDVVDEPGTTGAMPAMPIELHANAHALAAMETVSIAPSENMSALSETSEHSETNATVGTVELATGSDISESFVQRSKSMV